MSNEQAQAAAEELGNQNDNFGELRHAMHEMHEMHEMHADMKSELGGLRSDFRSEQ